MKRIFNYRIVSAIILVLFATVPIVFLVSKHETISIGDVFLLPFTMVVVAVVVFAKVRYKEGFLTDRTERLFSYLGVIAILIALVASFIFMSAIDHSRVPVRSGGQETMLWFYALSVPSIAGIVLGHALGNSIATTS